MTSSSNPIEAVRARLDGGRKWHKGSMVDGEATCLLGAVCDVQAVVAECSSLQIREVIKEQFPDRVELHSTGLASIPFWNDHPDTVWADVDLVLDKASIAWDEQVQP